MNPDVTPSQVPEPVPDHHDHEVPPSSSTRTGTRPWECRRTAGTVFSYVVNLIKPMKTNTKPEELKVVTPHHETNPHVMRSTQPPAEDPPQRLRPGWLRPPRTEQPSRDPVLPPQPRDSTTSSFEPRREQHSPWRQSQVEPYHYQAQLHPQRSVHPCAACFAVIFCLLITLAALAILIIYLIFRPWSPLFGFSTATTLNGLTLQKGNRFSVNLTLVTNFTNPNKKAGVDFKYVVVELYFGESTVATKNIEHDFSASKGGTGSIEVDVVANRVHLTEFDSQGLKRQMVKNKMEFEVKGNFLVHTRFGPLVRYSHWMHGQCSIILTKPPHGVLISSRCNTTQDQKFV